METPTSLHPSTLSSTEREQLRTALEARYPHAKNVLGSQLGAFVRRHLTDPDLKRRFGGLKEFITNNFPAEIVWRGRQGLDDLYDISFGAQESGPSAGAWQPVCSEPSVALWSAVTNPTFYVQFAWSSKENSLLQAPLGVTLTDDLAAIQKLTKADYRAIAAEFVNSLASIDDSSRNHALESSGSAIEFTKLMREKGLLAKWEEFRIEQARLKFSDRLAASGAESSIVERWANILRLSQQKARVQRLLKAVSLPTSQPVRAPANREFLANQMPDSRVVAIKAMEFLSDSELGNLSLPLGTVMRALVSLVGHP